MEQNEVLMIDGKKLIISLVAFMIATTVMCIYATMTARSAILDLESSRRDDLSLRIRLKRLEASYGTSRREHSEIREEIEDIRAVISAF